MIREIAADADRGFLRTCTACLGTGRALADRYRDFLLAPESLAAFASLALLLAATILSPASLIGDAADAPVANALLLAAALVGSAFIWWSAIQGIRQGDFTADIPVSVATAAALAIGQYPAAAIVAVLLLLGGMLENFVAARAGKAMEALAALLPSTVTVRRADGEHEIALDEVQPGDLLLVRSGERIAVDGHVEKGTAAVDQAAITGESVPVEKVAGDAVFAGTFCAGGVLEIQAQKVGDDTTLGQIRRMIEDAQHQKAPIERLLDQYAKLYTPVALGLGAFLWWLHGDILQAITILIVFCPCVMVLATPTALVASIGNAALRGSLVKKGATIEALASIDTVAFDKTGTVTYGRPRLIEVVSLNGLPDHELLRLAAVAEKFSEHPLGRAVVAGAAARALTVPDPDEFVVLPGLGVEASTGGQRVTLGNRAMLAERGIRLPADASVRAEQLEQAGRGVLPVAVDGGLVGLLVVEDTARREAKAAIAELNRIGIRTALVTGDNRRTAERIAADLGITEIYADVLPKDKVGIVTHLQSEGRKVAFVGDGVNDGPALAAANVGVAMGIAGTDVAVETAEIALLADDLSRLPHLLLLSRQALTAIKQNVVFSLGVLAAAVGLTFAGVLTPVTGALLHELSSIPVIANSARLIAHRQRGERRLGQVVQESAT